MREESGEEGLKGMEVDSVAGLGVVVVESTGVSVLSFACCDEVVEGIDGGDEAERSLPV